VDIIENRYRMITEPERSGETISDVCIAFGVSRETWYKWKRRYDVYGIDGLKNQSRKPRNIKNVKVTEDLEKIVLELRLNVAITQTGNNFVYPHRLHFSAWDYFCCAIY
jgi:transposase